MKLYISQADIDAGEPCMASKCAIALAFTRATGLRCQAGADRFWVLGKVRFPGEVSVEASRFISLFDCDKKFCVPTVVEIYFGEDAPPELQRDYVPSTDLADIVAKKVIPGKPLPQVVCAH